MEILNKLCKICETKENADLKTLCTIKIGGIGRYVCFPKNIKELKHVVSFLENIKQEYYVIGNGSNIIFEDGGVSHVLICLKKMCGYKIKGNKAVCESGLTLFALHYLLAENNLSGLEWSYGIPASLGGAVRMNAGAYGSEMKDFIKYVWVLSNGKIKKYKNKDMWFGYRTSRISETKEIVTKVMLDLNKGEKEEILTKQKEFMEKRKSAQPYNTRNAGSIFKKSFDGSAGKTIDKLGLKSVKIGNIQISSIHANFFINLGNGTSADLHKLIDFTKTTVKEKTGIDLEEEVIFVGNKKE